MIAACTAAHGVQADPFWMEEANRAFAWFLGWNDQDLPMIDEDGACRDGLRPEGLNQNRGGESVLSYLLALVDMHRLVAACTMPVRALRA